MHIISVKFWKQTNQKTLFCSFCLPPPTVEVFYCWETDQFDCQYKWGMITENKSGFTSRTAWDSLFGGNLRIKQIDRTGSVKCDKLDCFAETVPQTIRMLKLKEQWGAGDLFDCCSAVEKTLRIGSSCTETRFNSGQPLPPSGYHDFIKWAQICICVNTCSIT